MHATAPLNLEAEHHNINRSITVLTNNMTPFQRKLLAEAARKHLGAPRSNDQTILESHNLAHAAITGRISKLPSIRGKVQPIVSKFFSALGKVSGGNRQNELKNEFRAAVDTVTSSESSTEVWKAIDKLSKLADEVQQLSEASTKTGALREASSMAEIDTRVQGIPCIITVTHFNKVKGSHSYNAPSDLDYHGYADIDWHLCDRRGRPAPWLERKLTRRDKEQIESEILEYFAEDDGGYDDRYDEGVEEDVLTTREDGDDDEKTVRSFSAMADDLVKRGETSQRPDDEDGDDASRKPTSQHGGSGVKRGRRY